MLRVILLSVLAWLVWRGVMSLVAPPKDQGAQASPPPPYPAHKPPLGPIQDLQACSVCATWRISSNKQSCGRTDCPFG